MKALNIGLAVLGGAALGAVLGIIFAPEKGEVTRERIKEFIKRNGYEIPKHKIDAIVDKIEAEIANEA